MGRTRRVMLIGGTGLVGSHVLSMLGERPEVETLALVRHIPFGQMSDRIRLETFDFDRVEAGAGTVTGFAPDVFLCCLGTTIRTAGSPEEFVRVDHQIPAAFVRILSGMDPRPMFGLVSSVGTDRPVGLYLETKARLEAVVRKSGLAHVILRPSVLLGKRGESRPLEALGQAILPAVFGGLEALSGRSWNWVGRLAPIPAARVAAVLLQECLDRPGAGDRVLEGYDLTQ